MTTVDFITTLFYEVDEQMGAIPKHPEARLWPSEVVTLGLPHSTEFSGGVYSCSPKASGGEDLQVEHPVCGGQSPAFHCHPALARVQGPTLVRDEVVQVCQAGEKHRLTPAGMVEALHGEKLAVDGVVRLIQHGAHRWHLGVGEHRIPARFLCLEPVAHTLAVLCANGRGDVVGTVA